jgi:fructose-specific phosphotransferase system IIC component
MLRFIKHNLTGIDGVAIYPILSLLIFVIFFAVVITYVIRMKKKEVEEISNIPLDLTEESCPTVALLTKK